MDAEARVGDQEKTENKNLLLKMVEKWDSLTTAQKAYVGSLALLIGVNILDNVTTVIGLSGGKFEEVGKVAAPLLEAYGVAGLWLSKSAITVTTMVASKVIDSAARFGHLPGEQYYGTAAAIAFTAVSMAPVINNIALLVK